MTEDGLSNSAGPLDPAHFAIDSFHGFEGRTRLERLCRGLTPADMSIVYAVSSEDFNRRGSLVGAYGANAQDFIHKMVKPLNAHEHEGGKQPVRSVASGEEIKV